MIGLFDDPRFNPPEEPERPQVSLVIERDVLARQVAGLQAELHRTRNPSQHRRIGRALADAEAALRRTTTLLLSRAAQNARTAPHHNLH